MFSNTHFALATHVMVILTIRKGERVTSAQLAESVNTNAAFLRMLLGRLKKAGLVDITLGKGGGAALSRRATQISLLDVYRAVDAEPVKALHHCAPNETCLVGRNIVGVLEGVVEDVESAAQKRLARRSVADVAKEIIAIG